MLVDNRGTLCPESREEGRELAVSEPLDSPLSLRLEAVVWVEKGQCADKWGLLPVSPVKGSP